MKVYLLQHQYYISFDPKLISKYIRMAALISNFDIHNCLNLKNFDAVYITIK